MFACLLSSNCKSNKQGGFNLAASGLSDSDLPFSVWGKLRRDVGDWGVSAKIDASSDNLAILKIDLLAKGGPTDLTLRVQGSLDTGRQRGELRQVGFSQSIEAPGGDLSLTPRFNLASGKADVTVEYAHDDTRIKIDAGTDHQRITVAQRIDDANSVSPSITSDGELQFGYRRVVGDGAVTAIYKPNDRTSLRYEEGPWVATVDIPMDGYFELNSGDAMVNIRRSVKMEAI